MRVTVVPADHLIIRDETSVNLPEWPFKDDHIHAIQFLDGSGEIELKGPPPVNEPFEGLGPVQPYLDKLDTWLSQQSAASETPAPNVEMVRARDEAGLYIADDPNTPEDEAWVEAPTLET